MKIVYDTRPLQTPSNLRGIGTVTRSVLEALSRVDADNEYLLLRWPGPDPDLRLAGSFRWSWLEVPRPRPAKLGWLIDHVTLGSRLFDRADCAHFNSPFDLDMGWPHLGPSPPRQVVTLYDLMPVNHWRDILQGKHLLLAPLFMRMAAMLRYAWRIVSISESTAAEAARALGLDRSVIRVAPLGVAGHFRPAAPEQLAAFRERHGLQAPYLLYVGGSNPNKNLARLLRAVEDVPEVASFVLLTRGAFSTEDARVRIISDLEDEELPLLYGAARLVVLASLFEGFGLPVLEAMSCGTPVACSDIPPLREVASSCARYFCPTDVGGIRDGIRHAWNDESWQRQAREDGLQRAASFTWECCARRVLDVYEEAGSRA